MQRFPHRSASQRAKKNTARRRAGRRVGRSQSTSESVAATAGHQAGQADQRGGAGAGSRVPCTCTLSMRAVPPVEPEALVEIQRTSNEFWLSAAVMPEKVVVYAAL